jgi:hypothetical protein
MNIGLTQNAIGQYRDAVDSIRSGMAELPADQQNAEWPEEYQQALDHAAEQTRLTGIPPVSPIRLWLTSRGGNDANGQRSATGAANPGESGTRGRCSADRVYKPPESGGLYTRSRDGAMQGGGLLKIKKMRSR